MPIEILNITHLSADIEADLDARYNVHRLPSATVDDPMIDRVGPSVRGLIADGGQRVDSTFLDRLPALEVLSCCSAGYEGIDLQELARRGIRMGNISTALDDDVADTAIMLAMAARRDLPRAHYHVTSGAWRDGSYPLQHSFSGGRLGIAGMGRIGQAVAKRAEGFGKEIGYTARGPKAGVTGSYFDDLRVLAEWSDTLVLCLPGGDATHQIVNAAVLNALGPRGVMVNVGRGPVVDEAALIDALTSGSVGAAGLDVFENEPSPDPALVSLPNVTCYPHHASGTIEARSAMARLALDNLIAFFDGGEMPCEVAVK